jgi:hypothetical protein
LPQTEVIFGGGKMGLVSRDREYDALDWLMPEDPDKSYEVRLSYYLRWLNIFAGLS